MSMKLSTLLEPKFRDKKFDFGISANDLGMIFQPKLTWKQHVDALVNNSKAVFRAFRDAIGKTCGRKLKTQLQCGSGDDLWVNHVQKKPEFLPPLPRRVPEELVVLNGRPYGMRVNYQVITFDPVHNPAPKPAALPNNAHLYRPGSVKNPIGIVHENNIYEFSAPGEKDFTREVKCITGDWVVYFGQPVARYDKIMFIKYKERKLNPEDRI
ncbi:uncharacterized protein LOC117178467 [Belonocnema kinseyi]|uniref:uncharacterized protein LOC117178467 n=1 Tax=Belonocnema kinseyi TaxID=2817044 RepID=UPI00143DF743|nr:uncharacterized protein LOC117178467 [Belonocnema kinseyi]